MIAIFAQVPNGKNAIVHPDQAVPYFCGGAVVVAAQLVQWLLPTPEIRSSNPVFGKILSTPIQQ